MTDKEFKILCHLSILSEQDPHIKNLKETIDYLWVETIQKLDPLFTIIPQNESLYYYEWITNEPRKDEIELLPTNLKKEFIEINGDKK